MLVFGLSILVLVIFISPFFLAKRVNPNVIPGIVLSFGVFFTFCGIVLSLSSVGGSFSEDSILEILASLKFAFVTSVAGMFTSIFFKIFPRFYKVSFQTDDDYNDQIKELLVDLNRNIKTIASVNREKLTQIHDGNVENFEKIEKNNHENYSAIHEFFKTLKYELSEMTVNSVIDAFNKVVKDFNSEINEQLGSTFPKLNEATNTIYDWQVENQEVINDLLENLKKQSIDFIEFGKKIKHFVDDSDSLKRILRDIGDTISTMQENSSLIDQFSKSTNQIIIEYQNLNSEILSSQRESIDAALNDIKSESQTMRKGFQSIQETLSSEFEELNKSLSSILDDSVGSYDLALGRRLSSNLTNLDKQLTDVLGKLSKDYLKFLNQMEQVVSYNTKLEKIINELERKSPE